MLENLEALALASTRWICANCGLDVASVLDLEHIRAEKSRGPGIAEHEVPARVFSVEQSRIPEISYLKISGLDGVSAIGRKIRERERERESWQIRPK